MYRLLSLLILAAAATPEPPPDVWPGWRGPANGVSSLRTLPSAWSADRNVAWRVDVPGRGHSSPVVWGNRVFLTTDLEGDVLPGAAPVKHKLEGQPFVHPRSEEHTSELQSLAYLVCRLLLEKKKKKNIKKKHKPTKKDQKQIKQ